MNIEERDFVRLYTFIRDNYGVNLEKKKTLVEGRLGNVITQAGYASFHDYVEAALRDASGDMINFIITRLTTNYTYFMREETHYQFMVHQALPEWTSRIRNCDLRTWSAGCSTGEEAYTAAIVVQEFLGPAAPKWDATILATDISQRVLSQAKKGVYSEAALERLPQQWRAKYFKHLEADQWKVNDLLSGQVVFGMHNLMDSSYTAKFKHRFHMIFCRNVMIYFNSATKEAIVNKFYDVLEPGGYLFIGLSETLSGLTHRYEQISPAIYRKGI